MDYEQIAYEVDGRVATLTLDRPDRLNAFTVQMQQELVDAFGRADADDQVRVVVVTGRGRAFCAGADLSGGARSFDHGDPAAASPAPAAPGTAASGADGRGRLAPRRLAPHHHRDEGGLVTLRIYEMTKPVIAAINGAAVGIGITMTLPMDVRFAAAGAKIGFVFARRGIVPEAASSWFLPRVVGISRAMEWTATGRVFPAEEGLEAGLFRAVLPAEDVLPAACRLAREIADNTSPLSVALTRQLMWRMLGADHPMEAHKLDSRAIDALGQGPDAREGVSSFLEKRPPVFKGRPSTELPDFYPWWDDRPWA
jgi:enoyl-CoA hydratase/carnithine racemase